MRDYRDTSFCFNGLINRDTDDYGSYPNPMHRWFYSGRYLSARIIEDGRYALHGLFPRFYEGWRIHALG